MGHWQSLLNISAVTRLLHIWTRASSYFRWPSRLRHEHQQHLHLRPRLPHPRLALPNTLHANSVIRRTPDHPGLHGPRSRDPGESLLQPRGAVSRQQHQHWAHRWPGLNYRQNVVTRELGGCTLYYVNMANSCH